MVKVFPRALQFFLLTEICGNSSQGSVEKKKGFVRMRRWSHAPILSAGVYFPPWVHRLALAQTTAWNNKGGTMAQQSKEYHGQSVPSIKQNTSWMELPWNISTTIRGIARKFCTNIHGLQSINSNDFGDLWLFLWCHQHVNISTYSVSWSPDDPTYFGDPLTPSSATITLTFSFFIEIARQLLDGLLSNLVHPFMVPRR